MNIRNCLFDVLDLRTNNLQGPWWNVYFEFSVQKHRIESTITPIYNMMVHWTPRFHELSL